MTCRIDGCDAERMPKQALCREHRNARDRQRRADRLEPVPETTLHRPRTLPDALTDEARADQGPTILVIPDTQVRPGVPIDHLRWVGRYINATRPDHVVMMGDWFDWPSLSRYDSPAAKALNGYETTTDYDSGAFALQELMLEVEDPDASTWDVTLGNHEHRREIALSKDPHLSIPDYRVAFHGWGWRTHEFLQVHTIEGVAFSHFFPRSANGKITQTKRGAPTARAQAQRESMSTVAGHAQGYDMSILNSGTGPIRAIIAGSCYLHDELYMPDNNYWRGILELRDVANGNYELKEISLKHLRRRYA